MTENAWLLINYIQLYVWKWISDIGHFQKYHNTLCLSSQILHRHCFHFLLGLAMVPRENENNAYAKFWKTSKEYYGIFESGLLVTVVLTNTVSKTLHHISQGWWIRRAANEGVIQEFKSRCSLSWVTHQSPL